MKDCWSILGISSGASSDDIKKAYRKLALQYHPDRKGGNAVKFREVHEAYEQAFNEKPQVYVTIFVFDFGHEDEIIVFKYSDHRYKYTDYVLRKKGRLTAKEKGRHGFIIKAKFIPRVITKPYFIIKGKNIHNTIGLNIEFDYYTYIFGCTTKLPPMQSTHILGRCHLWSQIIIPRGKKEHVLKVDILSQKDIITSNIYEIKIFMKLKKGTWFSRIKELLRGIVGYEPYIEAVEGE